MQDNKALEIISLYQQEESNQMTLRSKWQDISDYQSPVDDQITLMRSLGSREDDLYDETAKFDCMDMISGLFNAMIPSGQLFFALQPENPELEQVDVVRRYLAYATERTHAEIFKSNFVTQINEAFRTLLLFGPCAIRSEFDLNTMGLNYKAAPIGMYQFIENHNSSVDTIFVKYPLTARQAYQQFVEDMGIDENLLGQSILDAYKSKKRENEIFEFIHCVRPRKNRNQRFKDAANMAFESVYVNLKEKTIIDEGGYEEFCYACARWLWSPKMKYGTGQGMMIQRTVMMLQKMQQSLIDCANLWNFPPSEVIDSFEGKVNRTPGATNRVQQIGSIKSIEDSLKGSFPITKDMLEITQSRVHKAYFKDIFNQLGDLTGDRRTTVEIRERLREALQRLSLPVSRVYSELFNSLVSRSTLLLIRNGRIEPPPQELQGRGFGIEYKGKLALALRSQQAEGFMQFAGFIGQMIPFFPDAADIIDIDDALPDMAQSFGVKLEHIASQEQIAQKRQVRAQEKQAAMAMQAAQVAGPVYKDAAVAPEENSPSQQLLESVGA